ncbi:hypothetical protein [Kitasatospora sp. NPDC056184]|uniref:hypothetical protein n=1 Tax=Kitasatospora sp. NPDC056184 TaxID=3345738 RepID=UPI0035D9CD51
MQLLAGIADTVRVGNYLTGFLLQAHGMKNNPVEMPEPIPRPGVQARTKQSGLRAIISKLGAEGAY